MKIIEYNQRAWDREVERKNKWTLPVSSEEVEAARRGQWQVVLTPIKPVPRDWFPADLSGVKVLGLASGGGQQGPIFAAAGADVTILDNSPKQLEQDRMVAERDGLTLRTVQGDMADLSWCGDDEFDVIFHPVANCFVPDILPVWREAHRVLRPGGVLMAGFANPAMFIFDDPWEAGRLEVMYKLPYDERVSISEEKRRELIDNEEPLLFSHTLEAQIGGQLAAGLVLTGLYEDGRPYQRLAEYMPTFLATRAVKPD